MFRTKSLCDRTAGAPPDSEQKEQMVSLKNKTGLALENVGTKATSHLTSATTERPGPGPRGTIRNLQMSLKGDILICQTNAAP